MVTKPIKIFFQWEAGSSILLVLMMLLALIATNSPLLPYYLYLRTPAVTLTINDGLMAFFFLMIGMEIRHEMPDLTFQNQQKLLLPLVAAIGGILIPALLFTCLNKGTPAQRGWAIPTATDIAFSLGILSFFGSKIPPALRLFLMMVAIIDDIAAVIIIAIFYSGDLSISALAMAAFCTLLLYAYNRSVTRKLPYIFAGAALWLSMFDSGIHPALSGVIVGVLLPMEMNKKFLPLLNPWVNYVVVPLFAFANAGVPLTGAISDTLMQKLPLGIAIGLCMGKQAGIFMGARAVIKSRLATLPWGCSWLQLYGVCALAGIGFTMSLFIASLAFSSEEIMQNVRLGIIAGSFASALMGVIILALTCSKRVA